MKTVVSIPARGGSVRLPRKNVLPFCGLPLVAWSIIQAKCSKYVDDVLLVTDDEEIAEIGKEYGAEIVMQPTWQCQYGPWGGTVAMYRTLQYLIDNKRSYDLISTFLPTNVLRFPDDLDNAIDTMLKYGCSHIAGVGNVKHPGLVYKAAGEDMYISLLNASNTHVYRMTCAIGIMSWEITLANNNFSMDTPITDDEIRNRIKEFLSRAQDKVTEYRIPAHHHLIEEWQLLDIDTEWEFRVAELYMQKFILKGRGAEVYYEYGKSAADDTSPRQV